jgi:hypothetical protein
VAYATECFIMETRNKKPKHYPSNMQIIFHKHKTVFELIPPGQPPDRGFEHIIELEEGVKPMGHMIEDLNTLLRSIHMR